MFHTSQSSVIVGYGVILGDQKHFEKCRQFKKWYGEYCFASLQVVMN